jgi:hypothetical protein
MRAFLCIYHQRATFQKVICQKISAGNRNRPAIKAIEADLADIMYSKGGDTEEESLQIALTMCDAFCEKWKAEKAVVEHFQKHWLPKLSKLPVSKLSQHCSGGL